MENILNDIRIHVHNNMNNIIRADMSINGCDSVITWTSGQILTECLISFDSVELIINIRENRQMLSIVVVFSDRILIFGLIFIMIKVS